MYITDIRADGDLRLDSHLKENTHLNLCCTNKFYIFLEGEKEDHEKALFKRNIILSNKEEYICSYFTICHQKCEVWFQIVIDQYR